MRTTGKSLVILSKGAVEFFTKDINEPVEFRLLNYDVNSVMHFGNREFSKNGHKTIIFKEESVTQNRIGLTTNDIRKFDIVYGPECLRRDRQAKIDICQQYPNVARRKRDTSNVDDKKDDKKDQKDDKNDQTTDKNVLKDGDSTKNVLKDGINDQVNDKKDQNSDKIDENTDKDGKNDQNKEKNDEANFRSETNTDVDKKLTEASVDDTKIATKSLRVNPNITPPPNLEIPQSLHDLGIEDQVQIIIENVYKASAAALNNARHKYCKVPDKKGLRTGNTTEKAKDVLGIINIVSEYAQEMVDNAMANLTRFCDDADSMSNYERQRCSFQFGGNPRCTPSYRSTMQGIPKYSTKHRPYIIQSTKHWSRYKDTKYHNIRRSNGTGTGTGRRAKKARRGLLKENTKAKKAVSKPEQHARPKRDALDENINALNEFSSSTANGRAKREVTTPNTNENTTLAAVETSTVTVAKEKLVMLKENSISTNNETTTEETKIITEKTPDTTESNHDLEVKKSVLRMGTGIPRLVARNNRRADFRSFVKSNPKEHPDSDVSIDVDAKINGKDVITVGKDTKNMSYRKHGILLDIKGNGPEKSPDVSSNKHTAVIGKNHDDAFDKSHHKSNISSEKEKKEILNKKHDVSIDYNVNIQSGKDEKEIKQLPNIKHTILSDKNDESIKGGLSIQKDSEIVVKRNERSLEKEDSISKTNHETSLTKDSNILTGNQAVSIYKDAKMLLEKGIKIQERIQDIKTGIPIEIEDPKIIGKNDETHIEKNNNRSSRKHGKVQHKQHYMRAENVHQPYRPSPILRPKRKHYHGAEPSRKQSNDYQEEIVEKAKQLSDKSKIYEQNDKSEFNRPSRFRVVRPKLEEYEKITPKIGLGRISTYEINKSFKKPIVESWKDKKDKKSIYEINLEADENEDIELEQDHESERDQNSERERDRESERDHDRERNRESKRDPNREFNQDRDRESERERDGTRERDLNIQDHDRALEHYKREQERRIQFANTEVSVPPTVKLSKINKEFYRERRWPGGIVHYMIKPGLKYNYADIRRRIEEVNAILKKRTCVRLEEMTDAQSEQFEDFIFIDDSPDYVTGRVGGKQNFGAVELLEGGQHRQHAAMMVMAMLGFYFEVSRHDRDSHIRVHQRHVRPDKLHHFEKIREDATLPVPYDYKSATHPAWQFWRQYGVTGISSVATYKHTDPDGSLMKSLGQNRQLLSDTDILKINSVYGVRCFMRNRNERKGPEGGPQMRSRPRDF